MEAKQHSLNNQQITHEIKKENFKQKEGLRQETARRVQGSKQPLTTVGRCRG